MDEKIKFKRSPRIIFREEGEVGLLFDPENGSVKILNETGKFIWSSLEKAKTRSEIIDEVMGQFDVPAKEKCEGDVNKFISQVGNSGLLDNYAPLPKFPTSVCFGITSRCNFSCKHCLNRNLSSPEPDMTTDKLIDVIKQMARGGTKGVSLFGGEPLCHPDFKLIVEQLNKNSISMSLNTNGSLVDADMAAWIRAHNIGSAVVSFDGSSASIMDKMRGKGAFEMSLKGVKALRAAGIDVLLSVTLNKLNYKNIKDMILLGKEIGGNSIRFNHVFFGGNAACFVKDLYLDPAEEREAVDTVWKAKEEYGSFVNEDSSYLGQKKKLEDMRDYKPVQDKISVPPCGAGRGKCAIRPDGWVVPCEILWEVKCGNLKKNGLKEIWEDSRLMNSFRRPLEVSFENMPECKGCQYQYMCFVGHRCYPYHNPGGVANRDLYCWLKKSKPLDK